MTGTPPNVSGEPQVVIAGSAMAPLVRAAAKLAEANLGRYAVIGGVAVSARLGQAHRATADIDTVVDDLTPPPAIDALLELPEAKADPSGPHRVLIDGIKVEVQATEPIQPGDLRGLTDKQILYVGAHRYALDSASTVTLIAEADDARAVVPVASAAAIVAMKLHAIEDRRPSGGLDKRAGDAWDIYRILLDLDRDAAVRHELTDCQLAQGRRREDGRHHRRRAARAGPATDKGSTDGLTPRPRSTGGSDAVACLIYAEHATPRLRRPDRSAGGVVQRHLSRRDRRNSSIPRWRWRLRSRPGSDASTLGRRARCQGLPYEG